MRVLAVLAAFPAVGLAGCGGSAPEQPPVEFLETLLAQLYGGEHGAAWDLLLADHKDVVTRREYVACEQNAPAFPGQFEGVEVLRTREEDWRVAGAEDERESTTVTYRITVSLAGEPEQFTGVGHLVAEDGGWHWTLNPRDFQAYRAGRCPVTSA